VRKAIMEKLPGNFVHEISVIFFCIYRSLIFVKAL